MKLLSLLSILLLPAAVSAQTHVSTEPMPRVAVLEEFTGTKCSNCPDGHQVAQSIKTSQPELFIPICVHAGSYARPNPGDPDFRTEFGEALNRYLSVTAYPAAAVNRVAYNGSRVVFRENWRAAARAIAAETSPVNLWAGAKYDAATRQLTVDVEAYFTSAVTGNLNLNVYLLESGIVGPQAGSSLGNNYVHNHMLRACITPDWGAEIADGQPGDVRTATYTYTVPEKINSVPLTPEGFQIVVTINKGKDEIITATECYPECDDFVDAPAVSISGSRLSSDGTYGYRFMELNVTSKMIAPITSLTFKTTKGFESKSTEVTVDCNIPRGATRTIEVPFPDYQFTKSGNRITATLTKINGEDYLGDPLMQGFSLPEVINANNLTFVINTDRNAADNRYLLRNSAGEIVKEFGPYENGTPREYREEVELPEGSYFYCLEVSDAWGDGVLAPSGSVEILDADGKSLRALNKIDEAGTRMFFRTGDNLDDENGTNGDNSGLTTVESDSDAISFDTATRTLVVEPGAQVTVYGVDGRVVATGTNLSALPAGVYVAVARSAASTATLKLAL